MTLDRGVKKEEKTMEPIKCTDKQVENMKLAFWVGYAAVFFFFLFVYWPISVFLFFVGWAIASVFVKGV